MTSVLLDTSAYSAMRRGDTRFQGSLREASEVVLTPIVLGELYGGFRAGNRERENRAALRDFMDSPRVTVVPLDEETAERYALIRDFLRREGTPISVNDIWIVDYFEPLEGGRSST